MLHLHRFHVARSICNHFPSLLHNFQVYFCRIGATDIPHHISIRATHTQQQKPHEEEKNTTETVALQYMHEAVSFRFIHFDWNSAVCVWLCTYSLCCISHANHAFHSNTTRKKTKTTHSFYSFALRALYWNTVFNKTCRYSAFGNPFIVHRLVLWLWQWY